MRSLMESLSSFIAAVSLAIAVVGVSLSNVARADEMLGCEEGEDMNGNAICVCVL
jgi:hypothetical protein